MKKGFIKSCFLSFVMILIIILSCSCTTPDEKNPPDNDDKDDEKQEEIDYTDLTVRDYTSKNGIVTAANPYAAKVGLDILKNGGNAFDAAVAVSLALGVCEMDATSLGGGGLMIAYNVNTKKSLFYNFREFASQNVSTNLADYKGEEASEKYTLYTAVPTQLAGINSILKEQGTMDLKDVLAPVIDLAKNGIIATPELIANINDNNYKIYRNEYLKSTFKRENGSRLRDGDTIIQKDLANTLQKISDLGIEYFYTGELSQKIIDAVTNNGGKLTKDDLLLALNKNYLESESLVEGTYKDYDILTVGSPSTGGTMLIEMLNMLEASNVDFSQLEHNSSEYINLIATVMQLAYGDKEKYLADKNFVQVPLKGILSKDYAKERISKYTKGTAYLGTALSQTEQPYGDPTKYNNEEIISYEMGESESHYSTTSFSVCDKDGNMITFTQTINTFFGSGISPEGSGFFLNDEMKDFSYEEGSINCIEPLKQPASYMLPTVVLKNGKPYATFGTPGGSRIPAAGLQVFLNMIEYNMNIQEAINAYRIYCFTTNESNRTDTTKALYIENGLNPLVETLKQYGYNVICQGEDKIDSYFGGVQGIKLEEIGYHGGADPRRDGKAVGY